MTPAEEIRKFLAWYENQTDPDDEPDTAKLIIALCRELLVYAESNAEKGMPVAKFCLTRAAEIVRGK